MRKLLFNCTLILVLFSPIFLMGEVLPLDSSQVQLKDISEQIAPYQANEDFNYERVVVSSDSWWDALQRWFWNWFWELFDSSGISSIWFVLRWILLVAVIVLILLRIFKTNVRGLFQSKSASNTMDFLAEDEDINTISFDELIKKAIAVQNYREAIRLSYLKILKQLTDKDLIKWQIDKTNLDYQKELKGTPFRKEFKETSLLFEYIFYGEFALDEKTFATSLANFNQLIQKLTEQ